MPSQGRSSHLRLVNLMDTLAESVITMSDDEILAEEAELAADQTATVSEVREVLESALKNYRQRHLQAARESYHRRLADLSFEDPALPETAVARRALLAKILAASPKMEEAYLTLQYRDFASLTDDDVTSCLKQLKTLGLLGDDGQSIDDRDDDF